LEIPKILGAAKATNELFPKELKRNEVFISKL